MCEKRACVTGARVRKSTSHTARRYGTGGCNTVMPSCAHSERILAFVFYCHSFYQQKLLVFSMCTRPFTNGRRTRCRYNGRKPHKTTRSMAKTHFSTRVADRPSSPGTRQLRVWATEVGIVIQEQIAFFALVNHSNRDVLWHYALV